MTTATSGVVRCSDLLTQGGALFLVNSSKSGLQLVCFRELQPVFRSIFPPELEFHACQKFK